MNRKSLITILAVWYNFIFIEWTLNDTNRKHLGLYSLVEHYKPLEHYYFLLTVVCTRIGYVSDSTYWVHLWYVPGMQQNVNKSRYMTRHVHITIYFTRMLFWSVFFLLEHIMMGMRRLYLIDLTCTLSH